MFLIFFEKKNIRQEIINDVEVFDTMYFKIKSKISQTLNSKFALQRKVIQSRRHVLLQKIFFNHLQPIRSRFNGFVEIYVLRAYLLIDIIEL